MAKRKCQALLPPYPGEKHSTRCPEIGDFLVLKVPDVDMVVWLCREHTGELHEKGDGRG